MRKLTEVVGSIAAVLPVLMLVVALQFLVAGCGSGGGSGSSFSGLGGGSGAVGGGGGTPGSGGGPGPGGGGNPDVHSPEPASMLLFGSGVIGLAYMRRRRLVRKNRSKR